MRRVRHLPTSLRYPVQQLFKPCVRPEEQRKTVREAQEKETPPPKLDDKLSTDIAIVLKRFVASEDRKLRQMQIQTQLRDLVESQYSAAPVFDVENISMWQDALNLHKAPFEFVVDKKYPSGINSDAFELLEVYSPSGSEIVDTLPQHGFCAHFQSRQITKHWKLVEGDHNHLEHSPPRMHARFATKKLENGSSEWLNGSEARKPKLSSHGCSPWSPSGARSRPALFGLKARQYHTSATPWDIMMQFAKGSALPKDVFLRRARTFQRVSDAITKKYGNQYQVKLFGSTRYGVDSEDSDLDLVILDPSRRRGFAPGDTNLPPIYNIRNLENVIRRAGFKGVVAIPKATVPIVKFTDPTSNISCDLNVNDRLGLINTLMIKRYCELAPVLRPVLVALKKWAKPLALNDPAARMGAVSFSSYTLTLMTIAVFQMKGLLPNLQEGFGQSDESNNNVFWLRRKHQRICCDARFSYAEDWRTYREIPMREAMLVWFRYWSREHKYEDDVVSVRHGGLVPRHDDRTLAPNPISAAGSGWKLDNQRVVVDEDPPEEEDQRLIARVRQNLKPLPSPGNLHAAKPAEGLRATADHEPLPHEPLPQSVDFAALLDSPGGFTSWSHPLCIADPFIPDRNLAGNISFHTLENFKAQCERAVVLLADGGTPDYVVQAVKPVKRIHFDKIPPAERGDRDLEKMLHDIT